MIDLKIMDIAAKYDLIAKLRVLAEDPRTPLYEAESARKRICEIEESMKEFILLIQKGFKSRNSDTLEHDNSNLHHKKAKSIDRKSRDSIKNKKAGLNENWPFGYTARHVVEIGTSRLSDKSIGLEWKCPSCGKHVECILSTFKIARLSINANGVNNYIDSIRKGVINQLCDECQHKYK